VAAPARIVTRLVLVVAIVLTIAGGGAAWWVASAGDPVTKDSIGDSVQTRARGQLPVFANPGETAELYRFAVEHPEVLAFMPCTCGCGSLGHPSNRACYVKAETTDRVTFTSHAAT
jgi:hypothetical protein